LQSPPSPVLRAACATPGSASPLSKPPTDIIAATIAIITLYRDNPSVTGPAIAALAKMAMHPQDRPGEVTLEQRGGRETRNQERIAEHKLAMPKVAR
jgi:hypothetical protein